MLASRGAGAAAGRGGGREEAEGRSERSEYVCVLGGGRGSQASAGKVREPGPEVGGRSVE